MNHSTGKPTRAQAWRLEQLAGMRCIACVIEGRSQPHRTEVHHIVDKGYRSHSGGHDATLPLCSWHHRGIPPNGMKVDEAIFHYGPSLALNKRRFIETYGTERELLETVNGLLTRVA
jgi:hypothetical protein